MYSRNRNDKRDKAMFLPLCRVTNQRVSPFQLRPPRFILPPVHPLSPSHRSQSHARTLSRIPIILRVISITLEASGDKALSSDGERRNVARARARALREENKEKKKKKRKSQEERRRVSREPGPRRRCLPRIIKNNPRGPLLLFRGSLNRP